MKTSFQSIKLKQWNLAGCNIYNSLHETNGQYENLNSIKSRLHYHHATYYHFSFVANFIREYFMETDCTCKSHDIKQVWNTKTSHYHITVAIGGGIWGAAWAKFPPVLFLGWPGHPTFLPKYRKFK